MLVAESTWDHSNLGLSWESSDKIPKPKLRHLLNLTHHMFDLHTNGWKWGLVCFYMPNEKQKLCREHLLKVSTNSTLSKVTWSAASFISHQYHHNYVFFQMYFWMESGEWCYKHTQYYTLIMFNNLLISWGLR